MTRALASLSSYKRIVVKIGSSLLVDRASGLKGDWLASVADDMRERLAAYKCPKQVHVVDELPRNTMGKVQKNLLRDQYGDAFSG